MKVLNCVVIDDNEVDRSLLEAYLSKYPFLRITGTFANPVESLDHLQQTETELLFVDIDMPIINGIDFMKSVQQPALNCIFVTAHPEYAADAFDVQAVDYILKPIKEDRLDRAVQRVQELLEIRSKAIQYSLFIENDYLMIKEGTSISKVNINDIEYLEALTNYTKVITAKRKYITLNNLKNFLDFLPTTRFIRIHRSYAVALDKIEGMDKNDLLIAGQRLPLGKTFRQEVKKRLQENS